MRNPVLKPRLPVLAILCVALAGAVACTPEAEERTERSLDRTGEEVEAAGRRAGEELDEGLREAGEALERGIERADEELEPYARDAEITAKVKAKLTADPEVNPFRIDVDAVDGRVTLNGKVRTEAQRREAEELARGTEGVVEVVNLLEVGPRGG